MSDRSETNEGVLQLAVEGDWRLIVGQRFDQLAGEYKLAMHCAEIDSKGYFYAVETLVGEKWIVFASEGYASNLLRTLATTHGDFPQSLRERARLLPEFPSQLVDGTEQELQTQAEPDFKPLQAAQRAAVIYGSKSFRMLLVERDFASQTAFERAIAQGQCNRQRRAFALQRKERRVWVDLFQCGDAVEMCDNVLRYRAEFPRNFVANTYEIQGSSAAMLQVSVWDQDVKVEFAKVSEGQKRQLRMKREKSESPAALRAKERKEAARQAKKDALNVNELDAKKLQAVRGLYSWEDRLTDENWIGVLCQLGAEWRLSVSATGKRYQLAELREKDGKRQWVVQGSFTTLETLVGKYGHKVDGLREAAKSWPNKPKNAFPELTFVDQEMRDVHLRTDYKRAEYERIVRDNGSLRLVVTPCGMFYVLLMAEVEIPIDAAIGGPVLGQWQIISTAKNIAAIEQAALKKLAERSEDDATATELRGFVRQIQGLPSRAELTEWEEMPQRPVLTRVGRPKMPEPVKERAQKGAKKASRGKARLGHTKRNRQGAAERREGKAGHKASN